MSEGQFQLPINQFNIRFRPLFKMQDLFARQYLICQDDVTQKKVICKNYSVESLQQKQDVIQNMANFIKLNSIVGISKIVSFTEQDGELRSVFQCDGKILGEFIQDVVERQKQSDKDDRSKHPFLSLYIFLLKQLTKIVTNTLQIGMQLDDISRDNLIVYEPSIIPSSSSIQQDLSPSLKLLFDERQKDYQFLINPNLFPQIADVKRFPNKLYWSTQKIISQIIHEEDFSSQDALESVYQIGLLLLDIIYQCQSCHTDNQKVSQQTNNKMDLGLLDHDQFLANMAQKKRGYYMINRAMGSVERDEAFIAHKLNHLVNSNENILKHLGILIKNMIVLVPEMRYDLLKVQKQTQRINKLVTLQSKQQQNYIIPSNRSSMNQKNIQGFSFQQDGINNVKSSYESLGSDLGFLNNSNNTEVKDSFKYSENSLNFNQDYKYIQNNDKVFIKKQEFDQIQIRPERKQIQVPLTSTTMTQSPKHGVQIRYSRNQSNDNIGMASQRKIISQVSEQQYQSSQNSHYNNNPIQNNLKFNDLEEQIIKRCPTIDQQLRYKLRETIQRIDQFSEKSPLVTRKQYKDGSYYFGCLDEKSGKRYGLGVYVYKVGDIYFGEWKQNSLPSGTFLFKNGESYCGPISHGKQGFGKYRYINGNVYTGQWKDDLKNGQGVMHYAIGSKYQGEWVKGKKHGNGVYIYENGLQYRGGFVLGRKYGEGSFLFTNGTKIYGFWKDNSLEGKAIVQYYNGDRFQGLYHQSEKTGEGQYRWKVGQTEQIQYKGEFKKDNLEGFAKINFQNGEKYEGNIKNGRREGDGTYYYRNGDQFIGVWKQDKKQVGKYKFRTGQIFEGKFKNGEISFGTLQYVNEERYQGEFENGQRHGVGNYVNKENKIVLQGKWDHDQFVGEMF